VGLHGAVSTSSICNDAIQRRTSWLVDAIPTSYQILRLIPIGEGFDDLLGCPSPGIVQVGSGLALTYRLLLRSCRLMGVFVISLLSSMLLEPLQTAGPLAPRMLFRFIATTDPAESLLPSTDFPLSQVIRLPCSGDFSTGRGGVSPGA
jgi:hypothetical protein